MTPAELALWLRCDLQANADAVADLVGSNDLKIISDGDLFTLARAHDGAVTYLETGIHLPLLAEASA
jgi:hypothetical protein